MANPAIIEMDNDTMGGTNVVEHRSGPVTPMEMLDRALSLGASPDTLDKFMGLHERWEANQARKAFDEAIAAAKAEIPTIQKNKAGHNSRYADFAALARVVDPIISKYGLHYRFRTVQDDRIRVTCVLSHESGHSEENTLAGPPDSSGSKNAIQAIGSTLTYLQRYTLTQALGLAASDDDDGKAAGTGETISDEQVRELLKLIDQTGTDIAKFCTYFKINSVPELPAQSMDRALTSLTAKKGAK